ncbi:endoribonuclease YbeY [Petaurus breviceps papuanus]|uniref:endoribonuclease YbeY n=1 Tax=Petaurus breviceps papuanus TaxID=3040969 RepID=UPI0036DF9CBF
MSLVIRNLQRAVPVRRAALRARLELLRRVLGVQRFDLGVICVDDGRMRRLNGRYRGRPEPTDVLAFPFHEDVRAGTLPRPEHPEDWSLGSVVLGVEHILRQCRERGEDYGDVLTVTAAHGLCHLLGYKHNTAPEWQEMYHKEKLTLEALNKVAGTSLQPLTKNLF